MYTDFNAVDPAMGGGIAVAQIMFFIVVYVVMAFCLQLIAKKTSIANAWLAWIPIANVVLMLRIARKPIWWIILCLIPLVNIIIMIVIWMAICEARGKNKWFGLVMVVPFANLILPIYLAVAK